MATKSSFQTPTSPAIPLRRAKQKIAALEAERVIQE